MSRVTIEIDGMSCHHCVNAVSKALSAVPGVKVEGVSIGQADVSYDEGKADIEALLDAVADAGYSGSPKA
ncbi:MAG: heavy-metal-associated domain-containing protein [Gemmatimonadaceae bacterium]